MNPICRHCTKSKVNRPRGLCWSCYYTPGVKDLYVDPITGGKYLQIDVDRPNCGVKSANYGRARNRKLNFRFRTISHQNEVSAASFQNFGFRLIHLGVQGF